MENKIKELKQKLDKIWKDANGNIEKIKESFTELIKEETRKYDVRPYITVDSNVLENIDYDLCESILKGKMWEYLDSVEAYYYNEEEDFDMEDAKELLRDITLEFDAFNSEPSTYYGESEFGPVGDSWTEYNLKNWETIFKLLKKEVEVLEHYIDDIDDGTLEQAKLAYKLQDLYKICEQKFDEITQNLNIHIKDDENIDELKIGPSFYVKFKDRKDFGINNYKRGRIKEVERNGVVTYIEICKILDIIEDFYIFFNLLEKYANIKVEEEFLNNIKIFKDGCWNGEIKVGDIIFY